DAVRHRPHVLHGVGRRGLVPQAQAPRGTVSRIALSSATAGRTRSIISQDPPEPGPPRAARRIQFRLAILRLLPILAVIMLMRLETILPYTRWSQRLMVALDFQVNDADTGRPIGGALVELIRWADRRTAAETHTGPDGRGRIAEESLFVGHRSRMGGSRDIAMEPPKLANVSAPGSQYDILPFRSVPSMP